MRFIALAKIACFSIFAMSCLTTSKAEGILASVKTTGMAATGIAYPQDALAGAFNPAGMADVGNRFDVGFYYDRPSRHAKVHGNLVPAPGINGSFDASTHKNYYSGDFGINYEFGSDCCSDVLGCSWLDSVSVGLVVYNRNFNKVNYKHPFPLLGTTKLGMEYVHETVSATFAVKICDIHNIGVSVNWMIQRLKVNGLQNFDNPFQSADPGHVTNRGYSYSQGVGATIGYRGQWTDWLSVGATYQPKTHMSQFKKYSGFLAQHGRLDIPQKIGAGVAVRFLPCATVAFDMEHIDWGHVRALHNPLLPGIFTSQLGRNDGAGFGFRNQLYYRVGVDYTFCECWTVRAGFRHVKTPIRSSQTAVNLLTVDTIENYATVGATWCINPCNEVSFLYAHGFNHEVKGHNSVPIQLGGGEVDLRQKQDNVVGIAWGMSY